MQRTICEYVYKFMEILHPEISAPTHTIHSVAHQLDLI